MNAPRILIIASGAIYEPYLGQGCHAAFLVR